MIDVEGLVKTFPTVSGPLKRALDGIGFQVQPGEIYGLLGPNGAAKPTTLLILPGLMHPPAAKIRVNGIDVRHDSQAAKRYIGFLTANTGLYQRLSPRELLPYFAELH